MINEQTWKRLRSFAEVIEHHGERPAAKADLIALLPEADACITSWEVARLDDEVLSVARRLRAVAHMGGSVRSIVSDALWSRGIHVTSAAPALAVDVAETTLGLMIVGMKRIWPLARHVSDGGWRDSRYWPSRELHGKTVGIVGAGNVGRRVIELLRPFGVRVLVYDPYLEDAEAKRLAVTKVDLDHLLQESDVVSLHAPALETTRHLIDARRLAIMKDDALLINTARGSLIDEEALIRELSKGRFFAFLDVTDPEPPAPESLLRKLPNVVMTPHIAGCIEDCTRMGEMAVEELYRFFNGQPAINPITPELMRKIS